MDNRKPLIIGIVVLVAFFLIFVILAKNPNNHLLFNSTKTFKEKTISQNDGIEVFHDEHFVMLFKKHDNKTITLTIENKTSDTITACCTTFAINKVMTSITFDETVEAGNNKEISIPLDKYAQFCGVTEEGVKNITMNMTCTDAERVVLFESEAKTIAIDDGKYFYSPGKDSYLFSKVFEQDNINIFEGEFRNDSKGNATTYLDLFNYSEKSVDAEVVSVSINGKAIDCKHYLQICPGCTTYFPIVAEGISSDKIESFSAEILFTDDQCNELFTAKVTE